MMNDPMRRVLNIPELLRSVETENLVPVLMELAHSEVMQIKECFFLKDLLPDDFDVDTALAAASDRTDLESSFHVHIEDQVQDTFRNDPVRVLAQGVLYACELKRNLATRGRFLIFVSFTSPQCTMTPDGEPDEFTSCTVRFHALRPNELPWSDLGSANAILILDSSAEEHELCGALGITHVPHAVS